MDERLRPAARARSFRFAFRGVAALFRSEPNAWIHLAAALGVCGLGALLDLPRESWLWLAAAIAGVFAAEALNSALESLADAVHPAPHPLVGRAKDLGAAAVLFAAAGAVAIGLLVLGPPLLAWLGARLGEG
jgi:diacylglycerol kinase (ATP)